MIEVATGQEAGSVYNDRVLPRGKRGVVIKTHELDSQEYARAIHLVRYPITAIDSYFHWKCEIDNQDVTWDDHLEASLREWAEHTMHWLNAEIPVCLSRYEDLRVDPHGGLRRVLEWLDLRVSDSAVKAAVEQSDKESMRRLTPNLGDRFFRNDNSEVGSQFTPEQLRETVAVLNPLVLRLGYRQEID